MHKPTISIIVPVYNRPKLIVQMINSFVLQNNTNWECIIVDDGSNDNTLDEIRENIIDQPRFQLIQRNREPKGASTCRNIGVEIAKGDWIYFFDSDDLLYPWAIELMIEGIELSGTNEVLLFQLWEYHYNTNQWSNRAKFENNSTLINRLISFQYAISTPNVLWKKSFFELTNKWPENIQGWQDPILHLNALAISQQKRWDSSGFPLGIIRNQKVENTISGKEISISYLNAYEKVYQFLSEEQIILFKTKIIEKGLNDVLHLKLSGASLETIFETLEKVDPKFGIKEFRRTAVLYQKFFSFPIIRGFFFRSLQRKTGKNHFYESIPLDPDIQHKIKLKIEEKDEYPTEEFLNIDNVLKKGLLSLLE